jgi:hypothetical protein
MPPDSDKEKPNPEAGIPMKASKPEGSAIRMTRSKEPEIQDPNPPSEMAEKDTPTPETDSPPAKKPGLTPKLPPKKSGGLPSPGQSEKKKPLGALPPKKPLSPAKDSSVSPVQEDSGEEQQAQPEKPKLTPKRPSPAKPDSPEAGDTSKAEGDSQKAPESKEETTTPPKPVAKPAPPRPHVVKPGAASAPSNPTQGGAAVAFDSKANRVSRSSPVGLAIDLVACIGALAVGYFIITDLLKIL